MEANSRAAPFSSYRCKDSGDADVGPHPPRQASLKRCPGPASRTASCRALVQGCNGSGSGAVWTPDSPRSPGLSSAAPESPSPSWSSSAAAEPQNRPCAALPWDPAPGWTWPTSPAACGSAGLSRSVWAGPGLASWWGTTCCACPGCGPSGRGDPGQ